MFISITFTETSIDETNKTQQKLCTKNYENLSIFVKVAAEKSVAPFFLDTVYIAVLIEYRSVTDGQTDGHTSRDNKFSQCYA